MHLHIVCFPSGKMIRPTFVVIYYVCIWSTVCLSCIEADPLLRDQHQINSTSGKFVKVLVLWYVQVSITQPACWQTVCILIFDRDACLHVTCTKDWQNLFLCIGLITGNGETESIRGILVIVFGVIGAIGTIFAAIGTIIGIISTCKHHNLHVYFLELCKHCHIS